MTRWHWLELLLLTAGAAAALAAVPVGMGVWGLSWDALNHHVYLGFFSESPRWHLDVNAASIQSWQYPYLYWPVFRLTQLPIDGATAGAAWAIFLCCLMVPPLWVITYGLLPAQAGVWQAVWERSAACALGLLSLVVLSAIGTTANDPLSVVPLLWALALMSMPEPDNRRVAVSGAFWGMACAFKISNALSLPLLLVWWWRGPGLTFPLCRGWALGFGATAGFGLAYAPWGWQLWVQTGNPFFPFFQSVFGG